MTQFEITNQIIKTKHQDLQLSQSEKFIFIALSSYFGEHDGDITCWPSQTTIADYSGSGRKKVNETYKLLHDLGYVEVVERRLANGGKTSSEVRWRGLDLGVTLSPVDTQRGLGCVYNLYEPAVGEGTCPYDVEFDFTNIDENEVTEITDTEAAEIVEATEAGEVEEGDWWNLYSPHGYKYRYSQELNVIELLDGDLSSFSNWAERSYAGYEIRDAS